MDKSNCRKVIFSECYRHLFRESSRRMSLWFNRFSSGPRRCTRTDFESISIGNESWFYWYNRYSHLWIPRQTWWISTNVGFLFPDPFTASIILWMLDLVRLLLFWNLSFRRYNSRHGLCGSFGPMGEVGAARDTWTFSSAL
jgi:hypothetical protein